MAGPDLIENASPHAAALLDKDSLPLLDNPIWNSLRTEHRSLAIANRGAMRFPAAIGPLSGFSRQSPENYVALGELIQPGAVAVLFCAEAPAPPPGWTLIMGGLLTQMISENPLHSAPMEL